MTQQQFIDFADAQFTKCLSMLGKKSTDYSQVEDALDNFVNLNDSDLTPEIVFKVMFHMKDRRLKNLLKKDPAVVEESANDTILDRINYLILLSAYLHQKTKNLHS